MDKVSPLYGNSYATTVGDSDIINGARLVIDLLDPKRPNFHDPATIDAILGAVERAWTVGDRMRFREDRFIDGAWRHLFGLRGVRNRDGRMSDPRLAPDLPRRSFIAVAGEGGASVDSIRLTRRVLSAVTPLQPPDAS